jgi:purine nucleoside phosphorylase
MEGKDDPPKLKGIIPRTFDHIFQRIAEMGKNKQFMVCVSFLELYNEEIRDLLSKAQKKLEIKEKESGVYVKDLSKFIV